MSKDPGLRGTAIADLVHSFEVLLRDHRDCRELAGSILEVSSAGTLWGVAWMRCPDCGVRWERHLALNGAA